ncbi:unnamed protein product [Trichogramma brassicae]|uniref:Uncharacterized protein n=1 Tax=Trichogramma brassicae TaxID=86971 RepID=A0A6H5I8M7_9HYME|nr:unnamed protein product [Trichogramma brassicae]
MNSFAWRKKNSLQFYINFNLIHFKLVLPTLRNSICNLPIVLASKYFIQSNYPNSHRLCAKHDGVVLRSRITVQTRGQGQKNTFSVLQNLTDDEIIPEFECHDVKPTINFLPTKIIDSEVYKTRVTAHTIHSALRAVQGSEKDEQKDIGTVNNNLNASRTRSAIRRVSKQSRTEGLGPQHARMEGRRRQGDPRLLGADPQLRPDHGVRRGVHRAHQDALRQVLRQNQPQASGADPARLRSHAAGHAILRGDRRVVEEGHPRQARRDQEGLGQRQEGRPRGVQEEGPEGADPAVGLRLGLSRHRRQDHPRRVLRTRACFFLYLISN